MKTFKPLALAAGILVLQSCSQSNNSSSAHAGTHKTDSTKDQPAPVDSFKLDIHYGYLYMADSGKQKLKTYTQDQRDIILAINRLDRSHVRGKDTLIVPDTFAADFRSYSPFPIDLPFLKEVNKIIVFSYAAEAFGAYEHGHLVRWGPTSMGKKATPTPTGLFFANWKALETHSTVNDEWVLKWNFNIWNKGGVGFHQYDLPGYPASHSCLRLLEVDARYLYTWADTWMLEGSNTILAQGTPVVVYGTYGFGQRRPWLFLPDDPHVLDIKSQDLENLIKPDLDRIIDKQKQRDQVGISRNAATSIDTSSRSLNP